MRFGASTSPALAPLAAAVVANLTGIAIRPGRPGRNSDQAFNGVGLPLMQFNHTRLAEDGGYWWWHTPDDTYDKIDFDVLKQDTELYLAGITELVTTSWLRIDLGAETEALTRALRSRQDESGGALDLSTAIARVGELERALAQGSAVLENATPSHEMNLAALAVLRPLHRIMFVPGSDHHPDPGIYSRPLPGLEPARILAEEDPGSDRYGFARAQLTREVNRVLEALDEAIHRASDLEALATRLIG